MNKQFIRKTSIVVGLCGLLSACSNFSGERFATPQREYQLNQISQLSESQRANLFEAIIAADKAEQAQDYQSATSYYLFAADLSQDEELIKQSIYAARNSDDFLGLEQAAKIWLKKAPKNKQALGVLLEAQTSQQDNEGALETIALLFSKTPSSEGKFKILDDFVLPAEPREAFNLLRQLVDKYPQEVATITAQAKFVMNLANRNKRPDNMLNQALTRVHDALKMEPDFPPAVRVKAHILFQQRQDDEARNYLSDVFNRQPDSPKISHMLGQLLYDLRDFAASAAHYKDWLREHPKDIEAKYYLAASHYALSEYEPSFKHFKQLSTKTYEPATSAFYCGDSALKIGKANEALECFQRVKEGRFFVPATIQTAQLLAEKGNISQAIELLRADHTITQNEASQLILTEIDLINQYQTSQAAKQRLEQAIKQSPDNLSLILKKIDIYQLTEDPKKLLKNLDQAKALLEPGEKLDRFNLAAAALINNNGYVKESITWLESALKDKPNDKDLLYAKALYKEALGLFDEMVVEFKYLLSQYPDDLNIQNALGYTLADQGKELGLAKELINNAYQGLPDNPAVIDSKGWLAYKMGDLPEAINYLTRAFKISPSADIAAHLGEALWHDDKKELALQVWRKGQQIDENNDVLKKTLERLKVEL